MLFGLPSPQVKLLPRFTPPGSNRVSVLYPPLLVATALTTTVIRCPAAPSKVRMTPCPTRVTFIDTEGPFTVTLPIVIGADTHSVPLPVAVVSSAQLTVYVPGMVRSIGPMLFGLRSPQVKLVPRFTPPGSDRVSVLHPPLLVATALMTTVIRCPAAPSKVRMT